MAERYEQFRQRNGYNNEGGDRGGREGRGMNTMYMSERFSLKCRNQNQTNYSSQSKRTQLNRESIRTTCSRRQAQENTCQQPHNWFWFLEQFSIECRKTRTNVITLANHNRRRQSNEPIRAQSKYMWPAPSAGKRVRGSYDWFWFYFWPQLFKR